MKKTLSQKFKESLVKTKAIKNNQIKNDIEKAVIESIAESLKDTQLHELGNFGALKKSKKLVDGNYEITVDFLPNTEAETKIISKLNMREKQKTSGKSKSNFDVKKYSIFTLIAILIIGCGILFFIFILPKIKIENKTTAVKKDSAKTTLSDTTKDADEYSEIKVLDDKKGSVKTAITDTTKDAKKIVRKEVIDFKKDKEVRVNEDKSIIVKNQAVNDTKLKKGEYTTALSEIDGKVYNKYIYIIKDGDTLWTLADKFLFNPFLWPNIQKDNPYIKNPELIYPDNKITIYTIKK